MDSLRLTLVTPLKKVLESVEVSEIRVPADKGELTITSKKDLRMLTKL